MIASQTEPRRAPAEPRDPPSISVVIPSLGSPDCLDACLKALAQQTLSSDAEVIVVDCGVAGIEDLVHRRFPRTKLLSFAQRKSIPEMRALGMKHSRGAIVTVTEDHCVPESHWFERILQAHKRWYGVIGGAVENDPSITRIVDWAVFFCEYGRYMNPVPDAEVANLPGNNASYRREFLAHIADLLDKGCSWEDTLHARLRERGVKLYSDPSIIVYHKKEFGLGYFLTQRYHYSRSYAGMQTQRDIYAKRIFRAAICLALPVLLLLRITMCVVGKKRHLGMLFCSLPLIALFAVVWAWGELIGYLSGPGNSLIRVE
jgi:GT2 family glycosyltransferase